MAATNVSNGRSQRWLREHAAQRRARHGGRREIAKDVPSGIVPNSPQSRFNRFRDLGAARRFAVCPGELRIPAKP